MYLLIALLIAPLISNSQGAYEKYGLSYDGKGNLLEGRYILTTEEEQTVIVYQFNKGFLHGEFMIYAFNGNIIERGNYFDGQKHGKWINWTEDGIKTGEVRFNYGQRDGKWQIWDENGTLRYVMFYQVGEKAGNWKSYDEAGGLQDEKDYTRSL